MWSWASYFASVPQFLHWHHEDNSADLEHCFEDWTQNMGSTELCWAHRCPIKHLCWTDSGFWARGGVVVGGLVGSIFVASQREAMLLLAHYPSAGSICPLRAWPWLQFWLWHFICWMLSFRFYSWGLYCVVDTYSSYNSSISGKVYPEWKSWTPMSIREFTLPSPSHPAS